MVLCRQKILVCFVASRNIFQQAPELTSLLNGGNAPGTPPCNKNGKDYALAVAHLFPSHDRDVVASVVASAI